MEVIRRRGEFKLRARGEVETEDDSPRSTASGVRARSRWTLTQAAFDKLLAELDGDRERAGEKYQALRDNLISFFEWRGCSFPEDHADEALNRLAKRLGEGEEIADPFDYSFGIARLLLFEIQKREAQERQALRDLPPSQGGTNASISLERRADCLQRCLQTLSKENRELILQYYQGEKGAKIENRRKLAAQMKVSLNTLRMRALRLRERLEACVEECLKKSS